jgi:hypothetical protein
MINAFKKSFSYQLDSLSQYLKANYHKESPESGFAHHVFQQTNSQLPFDVANDIEIATLEPNRLSEAPALAAVGYGLACGRQFSEGFLETWANGLVRLSGREAFPAHRASFFYRPTELLGIALGVSYHYKSQPEQSKWLQDILVEGEQRATHSDLWTFLLSAYAAHILSVTWRSRSLRLVHEMTVDELALAKWLCSVEPTFAHAFGLIQIESSIDKALLEHCIEFSSSAQDSARAALLYFALKRTITQIIQSSWDDYEQTCYSPQKAVEWLRSTCNKVHAITQQLQSQLSRQSNIEAPNIGELQMLLKALFTLRSDTDIIESQIVERLRMESSSYIVNNQDPVITGANQEKRMMNSLSDPKFEKEIFISYAWGGESEKFVDHLDRTMQTKGVKIVRDKRDLGYKGQIKAFMERIGRGKCVIAVISEKYLKSPNCMFELVQIAKNGEFHDRIFPIVLVDAQIYDPLSRLKYIKLWEDKKKELNEAIKEVGAEFLQGIREEIDQYTDIRNTIAELTNLLKDMNTLTPDIHSQSEFEALLKAIENRLNE